METILRNLMHGRLIQAHKNERLILKLFVQAQESNVYTTCSLCCMMGPQGLFGELGFSKFSAPIVVGLFFPRIFFWDT